MLSAIIIMKKYKGAVTLDELRGFVEKNVRSNWYIINYFTYFAHVSWSYSKCFLEILIILCCPAFLVSKFLRC